jgi:hypothetical protein
VRASSIAYWAPKDGSSDEEYEDAWLVVPGLADEMEGDRVGVAVADGATESLLARQWATLLVDEFAIAPTAPKSSELFAEVALALAARWPGVVASYVAKREHEARPVAWYERPGLAKGAFATLLALQMDFRAPPSASSDTGADLLDSPVIGYWSSAALGDTCMFHVRGERLASAFPIAASADFDTSPPLLCSTDPDPQLIMDRMCLAEGVIAEGDDFYICTDALAAWFLASVERDKRPWDILRDFGETNFTDWLGRVRRSGEIRNDDVTLIHIDVW